MSNVLSLTLKESIQEERNITNRLKELGQSVANTGSIKDYKEMLKLEDKLFKFVLARLEMNEKTGNNSNIKELDLLTRKKEVLLKTVKIGKRKGFLAFMKKEKFLTEDRIEKDLIKINERIDDLNEILETFNNNTMVFIEL